MIALTADEAYGEFAYAYDQALGSQFFENLRPHLERVAARHATGARRHLDVACGTSHLAPWFAGRGIDSYGVDASVTMLGVARARNRKVFAGDFRALPLRSRFDVVTSVYDSLNHILEPAGLTLTFRQIRGVMSEKATFWFDMNHPSAYTHVWSIEEPFVAEAENYRLEMKTVYERARKRATGWVRGWSVVEGERIEIDEIHYQRSYSEREIIAALKKSGLKVVETFRFDPFGRNERPVKLFFVVAPA